MRLVKLGFSCLLLFCEDDGFKDWNPERYTHIQVPTFLLANQMSKVFYSEL